MARRKTLRERQLTIFARGGPRPGSGRKPTGPRPRVAHSTRTRLSGREPIFVTSRLVDGLPNLRRTETLATLRRALAAGSDRFGFRLVELSIQSNHLHAIAEADDARSLARGMQGLLVRIARALNRAWQRRGKVFSDRYHGRTLRSPREVRTALLYVLQNARKHGASILGVDGYSPGPWSTAWIDRVANTPSPLARARSWLLTTGWRRGGLLHTSETPSSAFGRT